MFFRALTGRRCGCNCNNGFQTVDFGCDLGNNNCECGMLGCYQINRIKWRNSCENLCDCNIQSLIELTESGYSDWRRDPVTTASRYLNSCHIPQDYKTTPAFLRDTTCFNGKTYVLLGFNCLCSIAFELCRVCNDEDVWVVCRYAYVN